MSPLTNRLQRTREMHSDHWITCFGNGLVVHTDPFMKADSSRILPIGGPQDVILNRLVCLPQIVAKRRVFDAFAGSGILGLMALQLDAGHVDFLDVNPRATTFQVDNAERNGFARTRYRALCESIADFQATERYDLVLANPPFVPKPDGIEGSLTSHGGVDGNLWVDVLLAKLDAMLSADGEAFIYLMQVVADGVPLAITSIAKHLAARTVELSPAQAEIMPFDFYTDAYRQCFPAASAAIQQWHQTLATRHGENLGIQHYVMHVQPKRSDAPAWTITENLEAKYGAGFLYPAAQNRELALARALENFVPA